MIGLLTGKKIMMIMAHKKHIVKITEQQYKAYINSGKKSVIDEAMHYPDFLDDVKTEVCYETIKCINELIKSKQLILKDKIINLKYNRQYFDTFTLNVLLNKDKDIKDKTKYGASSFSDGQLIDGKLIGAKINVKAPVSDNGETEFFRIRYSVCHEVTHLYDDWIEIKNGGVGVFRNDKTVANMNFMNSTPNDTNMVIKNLRWLTYLSIKSESNAFSQQIMQELEDLGASRGNIMEKYKDTASYNNLKSTEKEFLDILSNAKYLDLLDANYNIIERYRETSIPKINPNQFDAEKYLEMIKKWGNRILSRLARKYMGVVKLYYDRLNEEYYKDNCILIHD